MSMSAHVHGVKKVAVRKHENTIWFKIEAEGADVAFFASLEQITNLAMDMLTQVSKIRAGLEPNE